VCHQVTFFYCGSLRSGDFDTFQERRWLTVWQTSRHSCGVYTVSRNNSNIDYQKGAFLLFDGDTIQAALSAHCKLPHHSTNEDANPIRALPLGKVSPRSRITSECPLSPQRSPSPSPEPHLPNSPLSQTPIFRLQRYIHQILYSLFTITHQEEIGDVMISPQSTSP
jgi:hypothetical protein